MAVLDKAQSLPTPEDIVNKRLEQGPTSVEEIIGLLSEADIPLSRRTAKEIAWKMVEEGKARFNDSWFLELQK